MLIGLTGLAGSGKDTAYEFIADWGKNHLWNIRREAFADRLKVSAARAIGYSGPDPIAFCDSLKEPGVYIEVIDHGEPAARIARTRLAISGRQYLQLYGTEAHREVFGQDFWINEVIDTYRWDLELLVITDVRFVNEAAAIRDYGGEIWHIIRPSVTKGDTHVSEQGVPEDLITRTLHNTSSLDSFRHIVCAAMEEFVTERAYDA